MRIVYLSASYVPSRRANSMQVMKMCAALSRAGHDVELVSKLCPPRMEPDVADDFAFHNVEPRFSLRKLPRPARRGGGVVYTYGHWRLLRSRRRSVDLAFCRDIWGGVIAAELGIPVLFEAHILPSSKLALQLHARLFRSPNFRRLVVISEGLRRGFEQASLLPEGDRVVVAHDAADPTDELPPANGSSGRPRFGYVGHLHAGRGIEVIAELAGRMPEADFDIVGGHPDAVARWRAQALPPNLAFHGFVQPAQLPSFYARFDALLMPHQRSVGTQSGKSDISAWMSPMKMFEYMATGRAVISSDLPVLREVLRHEDNCLLVAPEDLDGWERALRRIANDAALRSSLARTARDEVLARYTWDARARAVLAGI